MNRQDMINTLIEQGYVEEEAKKRLEAMEEAIEQNGGKLEQVMSSARSWLHDLKVTVNSIVGSPAQPSDWTILKSEDNIVPLLIKSDMSKEEEEQMIAFAPALVPGVVDKQGDILDPIGIERAAHEFLTEYGEIDTNHELNLGQGKVVESWTTKVAEEYEMPDGTTKTYPKGTWMLGIKCEPDVWEGIKSGEYHGLSIYGEGDSIEMKSVSKPFAGFESFDDCVAHFEGEVDDPEAFCGWLQDEMKKKSETLIDTYNTIKYKKNGLDKKDSDILTNEEEEVKDEEQETPKPQPEQEKGPSNEDIINAIGELKDAVVAEIKDALSAREPDEPEEEEEKEESTEEPEVQEDQGEPEEKAKFDQPPIDDSNDATDDFMDYESIAKRLTEERDKKITE